MAKSDAFDKADVLEKLKGVERTMFALVAGGAKMPVPVYTQLCEIEKQVRYTRKELWKDYIKSRE